MRIRITIILFALTVNFANAQRNAQREQQIAEVRAYMAEVDSLINCRNCDAEIGIMTGSIDSRFRMILGIIDFPRRQYQFGDSWSYTLFSNCPEYVVSRWRDCESEPIYSWTSLTEWHRNRGKQSSRETRTYFKNNRKVAEIERITRNGVSETTTTFYNNRGRVIYRSSTQEKQ